MKALLYKIRLLQIGNGEIACPAEDGLRGQCIEKDQDARADILLALALKSITLVKIFKTSTAIWDF